MSVAASAHLDSSLSCLAFLQIPSLPMPPIFTVCHVLLVHSRNSLWESKILPFASDCLRPFFFFLVFLTLCRGHLQACVIQLLSSCYYLFASWHCKYKLPVITDMWHQKAALTFLWGMLAYVTNYFHFFFIHAEDSDFPSPLAWGIANEMGLECNVCHIQARAQSACAHVSCSLPLAALILIFCCPIATHP